MKYSAFLFILIYLILAGFSLADNYYWNDPAGGELGDSTKWNPSNAPGEDDDVYFTLPNNYTVWLDDYYTHDKLTVDGSDLVLDLNGYEYTLDTPDDYYQTVIVGDYDVSSLTLSGGSVLCGDLFTGRNSGDSAGTLNVSSGTLLSAKVDSNWHGFFFGTSGNSVVSVTEGALMEHGHGQSAIYKSSKFTIDGQDTEWYVDGFFQMSVFGTTMTDITNGAWTRFGKLEMGYGPRSSAVINVTGVDQNTALTVENGWDPISLNVGMNGKGFINLQEAYLYTASSLAIGSETSGYGELNIYNGSCVDIDRSIGIGGTLDQPGGTGLLYLYDDQEADGYADLYCTNQPGEYMVIWPDGTLRLDGGGVFMKDYYEPLDNPVIIQGGRLEGWGEIRGIVQNESGVVMPGVSGLWKYLNLYMDYEQGAAGTLKIGIGGTGQEWDYSLLRVDNPDYGQVTLDGFLDVDLLADFIPNYNHEFTIILAQSISGQFLNAPSQVVFEDGTFDVIYYSDRVVLTHFQDEPKCPKYPMADLNKDCKVDLADLAIQAGQWLQCNLSSGC